MEPRFKAGTTPPPQPRELQSRVSAGSIRPTTPEHFPKEGPITKDSFRLALRDELANPPSFMPEGMFDDQNYHIKVVVLGTNNSTKEEPLRMVLFDLPGKPFYTERIPGEENPRKIDTFLDAQTKAIDSCRQALVEPQYQDNAKLQEALAHGTAIFLANDVLSKFPVEKDGKIVFKAYGKPDGATEVEKLAEVKGRFKAMAQLLDTYDLTELPLVFESTFYLHNPHNPKRDAHITKRAGVWLDPDVVRFIASDEGFNAFAAFVAHTGKEKGYTITSIAGGMDIVSLAEMNNQGHRAIMAAFADIPTTQSPLAPLSHESAFTFAEDVALGHATIAFDFIHDYCAKFPKNNDALEETEANLQDFYSKLIAYRTQHRR